LQALFQSAQHIYEKREGSGAGSGSAPLTNGSGSGRPKIMRIRIPNTGPDSYFSQRKKIKIFLLFYNIFVKRLFPLCLCTHRKKVLYSETKDDFSRFNLLTVRTERRRTENQILNLNHPMTRICSYL
jgi:hypothetical protein